MVTAHEVALQGASLSFSMVPPRMDGSKRPVGEWAQYQRERPTAEQIGRWYLSGNTGVGIVCGGISKNTELLEFETLAIYRAYLARARQFGIAGLVQRLRNGYEEASPGGGMHWLYRCPEISGNTRLASDSTGAVLIETRGEGGYVIIAPSNGKTHPSGGDYILQRGGLDQIVTLAPEEREKVWQLARTFNEAPVAPRPSPVPEDDRTPASAELPGADYNARASWAEILEPAGWTFLFEHKSEGYWTRPGKDGGTSATSNYHQSGLFYVFTTSTAFEPGRGYSKFSVYAQLNHGGDFAGAARALRAAGYGAQEPQATTAQTNRPEPTRPRERPTAGGRPLGPRAEPSPFGRVPAGGSATGPFARIVESEPPRPGSTPRQARELQAAGLPAVRYAIAEILPEGVTLCAGRPKQGKSFLCLNLAIAVAAGGRALGDLVVEQGRVLYISLEGGEIGLLPRLNTMLGGQLAPEALEYATEWPRLDDGGDDAIAAWLQQRPDARLVIIDTLQRVRQPSSHKLGVYEQDYGTLAPLIRLSTTYHIAILVVHHTRKAPADDPLDTVSSSTGLTGAADAVWVLQRLRGQNTATLTVTGRSVPEASMGLTWDETLFSWRHVGDGEAAKLSAARQAIRDVLERESGGTLTAQEMADLLDKEYEAVRKTVYRMVRSGELRQYGSRSTSRYGLLDGTFAPGG